MVDKKDRGGRLDRAEDSGWLEAVAEFELTMKESKPTVRNVIGLVNGVIDYAALRGIELPAFTAAHLGCHLAARADAGRTEATLLAEVKAAKRFFGFCYDRGYVSIDPVERFDLHGDKPVITWEDAIEDFLASRTDIADATRSSYGHQLSLLARWAIAQGVEFQDFGARHFRSYITLRKKTGGREGKGVSSETLRYDVTSAKLLYRYANEQRYVDRDPLLEFKMPKRERVHKELANEDDAKKLIAAFVQRWDPKANPKIVNVDARKREFLTARDFAIFTGLIATGCRPGELLSMKMRDLDIINRTVVARNTKTHRDRAVPFEPQWLECLQPWLALRERRGITCDLLFPSETGSPMSVNGWGRTVRRYKEFAGVEGITSYDMRHWAATFVAEVSVLAARDGLGHASVATTEVYAHRRIAHVRAAYEEAKPLGRLLTTVFKVPVKRKRIY